MKKLYREVRLFLQNRYSAALLKELSAISLLVVFNINLSWNVKTYQPNWPAAIFQTVAILLSFDLLHHTLTIYIIVHVSSTF